MGVSGNLDQTGSPGGLNPEFVCWLFNAAEWINRESTALTVYRLARQKGMSQDDALREAEDLTYRSHNDYSRENTPRILQGLDITCLLEENQSLR
ncbi:hypothetical protein SIID45300_01658 [Candidatus Magnetaquicoccaceae bacterium FCR-1]|uniref:Uncharacterized protein n=2 Tax=Candidatus Magnetaquiglobus chichijimensis TaxID=3141448 RepID=A0ABQ0C8W9_9PROT